MTPAALAELIVRRADETPGRRFIVALAGPPGAGKSTLAAELVTRIGKTAKVVPMDGFHYDDGILIARGQRSRKGAPETFDVAGFAHLLSRLQVEDEVAIPIFDRSLELSRGSADIVGPDQRILIAEGNYLLLNEAPWTDLDRYFDLTAMILVPEAELDRRLLERWAQFGKTADEARAWIDGNDLPNIRRVQQHSRKADEMLAWRG